MSNLVKYMISLSNPQLTWLQAEADRLGISVPELIRRIIDKMRGAT